jgi:hypothetical protein
LFVKTPPQCVQFAGKSRLYGDLRGGVSSVSRTGKSSWQEARRNSIRFPCAVNWDAI